MRAGLVSRLPMSRSSTRFVRGPVGLLCAGLVAGLLLVGSPERASAKVFASQKQAVADAFPEATRVKRETRVVRRSELEQIESLSQEKQEAKVLVFHVAYRGDELLGVAHIDVHTVRTQPEAFLIVVSPAGDIRNVRVVAFHEPLDYLPTERWYEQFVGKTKGDPLRLGRDVHGVVGATLSARAGAEGVRRMLAYWEVLLKPKLAQTGPSKTPTPPIAQAEN